MKTEIVRNIVLISLLFMLYFVGINMIYSFVGFFILGDFIMVYNFAPEIKFFGLLGATIASIVLSLISVLD